LLGAVSPKAQEIYAATFVSATDADPLVVLERRALERVPEARAWPAARESESVRRPVDGRWHGWRTVSLVPAFTLERIAWYVALLLAFMLAQAVAADVERRRAMTAVLFLNFLALAVFGLVYAAIGNTNLYWVRTTLENATPYGPYVNPANFAAMMELATPWILATAVSAFRTERRPPLPFPILLASGICCAASGVMSGSRAGVVLIGLGLFALLVRLPHRGRALWTAAGVAVLAGAAWVVTASERLRLFFEIGGEGLMNVERLEAWKAAAAMFGDFRWLGAGVGAFRDVFPVYAPAGGLARMNHLHNDYFELALETGWPGAVLLVWLIGAFALAAWGRSRGRLTAYGLMIGLACLLLHALVDFNHQIPANALTFVTLAAIAVAPRRVS
jgi:O-antigen ligase